MAVDWTDIVFPLLTICCIILNACSLVILFRTNILKKKTFSRLLMLLSISDIMIGLEALLHGIILKRFISLDQNKKEYVCAILTSLCTASLLFSLFQVCIICIERFNATLKTPRTTLTQMTSNLFIGLGFVVFHLYPLVFRIVEFSQHAPSCDIAPTTLQIFLLDIPAVLLVTVIVALYIIVIIRILRQHNKIHGTSPVINIGSHQNQPSMAYKRMKKNVLTLGIIISISIIAIAPRAIASITSLIMGNNPDNIRSVLITTRLMILNPILDPIIYVLRMKKFRQQLACVCCNSRAFGSNQTHAQQIVLSSNQQMSQSNINNLQIIGSLVSIA